MATVTGDILALLDKIPIWKHVQETPARTDALEKRIAEPRSSLATSARSSLRKVRRTRNEADRSGEPPGRPYQQLHKRRLNLREVRRQRNAN
jgi:hypothetical protein